MQNKKNSLLKRMPGHDIALSKEWVSLENKYHMSTGLMNSGNKRQLGRLISQDLSSPEGPPCSSLAYMLACPSVGNEETYSVCITQGSSLKNSIRVTGSIKNSTVPQSSIYCKSILDRFSESGHDLRTVTQNIPGFSTCWDEVKDSCNDKNKILTSNNVSAEQTISLGEDRHVKQVVVATNTYNVGGDDVSLGVTVVKKINVFMNNNLLHETLFLQRKLDDSGKNVLNFTITTNLVKSDTKEVMGSTKNKDLARVLSNGDMLRSSLIVGLPYPLISYNVIDHGHDGISTMASTLKANLKLSPNERMESCLQELKRDSDNMTNMRLILDNALTKIFLIQGDAYDILKLDSVAVLP